MPLPSPFELHPGRKKLEYLTRELRRGDVERVRAGKELLRWQYEQYDWERHIAACSRRVVDSGELNAALMETAMNAARDYQYRPVELERGDDYVWAQLGTVPQPEEVLVTSTGILYGRVARLWHGHGCRFSSAEVEGDDPIYLILEFQKRWLFWWWGKTSVWVPVPRAVDADRLLESLEPWLEMVSTE